MVSWLLIIELLIFFVKLFFAISLVGGLRLETSWGLEAGDLKENERLVQVGVCLVPGLEM